MKIVELILDEDQEITGVESISIVENPAIEEDFIALESEEFKLAEVDKKKKILMGALLKGYTSIKICSEYYSCNRFKRQ